MSRTRLRALAPLLAGVLVAFGGPARGQGGEEASLRVERLVWADPALAGVRLRSRPSLAGRGVVVEARAPDAETADRLRERLTGRTEVEGLQVVVDPRLPTPRPSSESPEAVLEAARQAISADPAARAAADAMKQARLVDGATLELGRPVELELEPGLERRFARLLLAQPGVRAVRWSAGPSARAPASRERVLDTTPEPGSTPERPPAPPLLRERPAPAEPVGEPAERSAARALDEAKPPVTPRVEPVPSDGLPARVDTTPPEAAIEAAIEGGASSATGPSAPAARDPIDQAVEELLRRALDLEGAGDGVRVRVVQGVATYSGQVESRELAQRLRGLTRGFDGIVRVTGSLVLQDGSERIPMDALPD